MMASRETIGDRIKQARTFRDLTQKQLGLLCRCNETTIQRIESDRNDMHAYLFMEVGKVLKVSLDWLAFGEKENEAPYLDEAR